MAEVDSTAITHTITTNETNESLDVPHFHVPDGVLLVTSAPFGPSRRSRWQLYAVFRGHLKYYLYGAICLPAVLRAKPWGLLRGTDKDCLQLPSGLPQAP